MPCFHGCPAAGCGPPVPTWHGTGPSSGAFVYPAANPKTPLASGGHGLGLLTALAIGASGGWLSTQAVPDGLVLEVHKVGANLMWAYVVGYAGLAVLHQIAGHRVVQRMFARAAGGNRTP